MEKIELTQQQLKDLLQAAIGNVRDFVMNEDVFIKEWLDEQLILHNVSLSFKVGDDIIVCGDLITKIDEIDDCGKIWFYTNGGVRSWTDSIDLKHYSS